MVFSISGVKVYILRLIKELCDVLYHTPLLCQLTFYVIIAHMSLVESSRERKALDRLIIERDLAHKIAEDLPAFYARLAGIVMEGEDSDSIKAALALMDRLLGKAKDSDERPKQAFTVNICLLYTSDAADDLLCVDLGGRRHLKKKKKQHTPKLSLHH